MCPLSADPIAVPVPFFPRAPQPLASALHWLHIPFSPIPSTLCSFPVAVFAVRRYYRATFACIRCTVFGDFAAVRIADGSTVGLGVVSVDLRVPVVVIRVDRLVVVRVVGLPVRSRCGSA